MLYKFNECRRHKVKKVAYKVTNWRDYNAALRRHGGGVLGIRRKSH